ncbi:CAAX prenyl protease 2 isoform X2 [Carcharodon carcharias]|uniref:CAAX prenyl protease 2 isoform X2 n=1 Tax=Carcharodon carcharias TaxID=13397 RepID=UPI001B7EDA7A|nr:CAAX prenyl protease 2 isoform X2 [Carcharodon carcharias]
MSMMADHGGGGGPVLCSISVVSCLLLACGYVGSLYVWRSQLPRDHPTVIKRRFTSVLIVSMLSPLWLWTWRQYTGFKTGPSLLVLMGVHLEGIFAAACLPLLLTMVLFFGPLIQLVMDYPWDFLEGMKMFLDPQFWAQCLADMRWMRNQVVAPLTEELVFRACMLPMLVPCTGLSRAIITCPLFFGVVFQFSYTAVFGAYTAFIFIRTGHLIGPVLCHSFCNYMGFPAIGAALEHPHKVTIFFFYLLGVILFFLLLFPMTDPTFYGSLAICHLTKPDTSTSVCT